MTAAEVIKKLQAENPGFWEWLQTKPNALAKVKRLAQQYSHWPAFQAALSDLKSYKNFLGGVPDDDPPPSEEPPPEEEGPLPEDEFDPTEPPEIDTYNSENILDALRGFLTENELPLSLLTFIQNALAQKKSFARIVAELRQTPEYKTAYPEMDLRRRAGFAPMTEAEIRSYRGEARRLALEYFGTNLTNQEITGLITKDKSLREYEQDLKTWRQVEQWGPAVKQVLASELGYLPDDEMVFRLMHAEIPTPDLERAYERGLYRGQPASIGLGIRPGEEADILKQFGIAPEQAFRGYQNIVGELGRAERYAAIEGEINRNKENYPTGASLFAGQLDDNGQPVPFATLFRAIQLQDPEAIATLQNQLAREVARFRAGGGAAQSGSGAAVGLLTAAERQQR